MPYIHVSVNQPMNREACAALREEFAAAVTLLPGKTRGNAMIKIEPDCFMEIGDEGPCANVDVRLFHASPAEAKSAFVAEITKILENKLQIPAGRVYVQFFELPEWGVAGNLKS